MRHLRRGSFRPRRFSRGWAMLAAVLGALPATQATTFQDLGLDRTMAHGISADGSTVVGYVGESSDAYPRAFRWTAADGINPDFLPPVNDSDRQEANAASADGSVVVGVRNLSQAFRWTAADGAADLGLLSEDGWAYASGVSADGATVVGNARNEPGGTEAFRWTSATGMTGLGGLGDGPIDSFAAAVSADGLVVVGSVSLGDHTEAFRWTAATGMVPLGVLPGEGTPRSSAVAVSADGSVIIGLSADRTFRWTAATGMVALPESLGRYAEAMSADGSVIVGGSGDAWIWTAPLGFRSLETILSNDGIDLSGWSHPTAAATGVSADGRTITGWGIRNGVRRSWVVHLDESAFPTPPTLRAKTRVLTSRRKATLRGTAGGEVTAVFYRLAGSSSWRQATGRASWHFTVSPVNPRTRRFAVTVLARGPGGDSRPIRIVVIRK